ncbi:hypothetical protein GCM10020331_046000 [Ectobacillus funiculus]
MPLTPLDIHNKEFGRGFRGYDEDEVNEFFLDQVIKDYELVLREKNIRGKRRQIWSNVFIISPPLKTR